MSKGIDKLRASNVLAVTARVGLAVVALMLASALSGALLAVSESRVRTSGEAAVERAVKDLVQDRLGGATPTFERLDCSRRKHRRYRCRVSFFLGDVAWRGTATLRGAGAASGGRYELRLTRTKELCDDSAGSCERRVRWALALARS